MIRNLALAALLAAVSLSTAQAQARFGLKAGLNTATLFLDDASEAAITEGGDKEARLGFTAGAFAELPLSPALALRPEVLYAQKGVKVSAAEEGVDASASIKLDYVEVPVLLMYTIPAGSGLNVGVVAGPYAAFEISESEEFSLEGDDGELSGSDDLEAFKAFDLGGIVGVEVGAGSFAVGLRYGLGLLDLADDDALSGDEGGVAEEASARNGVFSVTASWTFGR